MVDRLVPCHVVLRHMYLTTFGVVLSINNLSLAQPRFASLQAQGFITSNVSNPLPSDTKNVMLTRTVCCASVGKREGATESR